MKKGAVKRSGPIAWMAGHSVGANLIMLLLLIGGYLSMRHIKQEVFPTFAIDVVNVSVAYPGASPSEVERGIVAAVENAITGIDGIVEVEATAYEGGGNIALEISTDFDPQVVAMDVKSAVDRIITFPEEAEKPKVSVASRRRAVLALNIYGPVDTHTLYDLAEFVRDELISHKEVSVVEVEGIPPLEISIEVDQEAMRRFNITLPTIAARLRELSRDIPAGGVKTTSGEVLVRVRERRDYGKEFGELPIITTKYGSPVLLKQIARVHDTFQESDRFAKLNGLPSVRLEVYREGRQTPIKVAAAVHEVLEKIRPKLPEGVKTVITRDRSEHYRQRMEILLKNGVMGLALVLLMLGLFLEPRLAFWVAMGIPVSFMGAFIILPWLGASINVITMFGFIIALGIVVDDAIVVGEQVFSYHQDGDPWLTAAIKGAKDVAMPVTFSILTNIVTFLPIYFVPGRMGKIFLMIPVVVIIVFIISLLESLFILPAHLAHRKEGGSTWLMGYLERGQARFSTWFRNIIRRGYGAFLRFTLRYRYVVVASAVAMLIISMAFALSGRMGFHLFPKIESDFAEGIIMLPYGTPVAETEKVVAQVRRAAEEVVKETGHPELVRNMTIDIGRGGSHAGRIRVNMAAPEIRNAILSVEEFTQLWRKKVGEIPGVEYMRFASDSGGPGGRGRPLTIELSHRDMKVLRFASQELAAIIATYPLVRDVDDGFEEGKVQLDITLREEGSNLGLTAKAVGAQLRSAFYGSEVLRQVRGRNEIKVMVRMPRKDRFSMATFERLMIQTPAGGFVPLSNVVDVKIGRSYTTILRRNGRRVVRVSGDAVPRSQAGAILSDLQENVMPEILAKYDGLQYSVEGHRADMRESLGSLKGNFSIALLIIYMLLAVLFRSYMQPLIVMLAIPFGVVGAFSGHYIMGYTLCIPSIFGIVALSGVVVNDSLVMIDFANKERRRGLKHLAAIKSAAISRFRPIFLTTVTTFGGLFPLIFEKDRSAQFLIPMALSLGFGILFATFITLAIVPSLYVVTGDVQHLSKGILHKIMGHRHD